MSTTVSLTVTNKSLTLNPNLSKI